MMVEICGIIESEASLAFMVELFQSIQRILSVSWQQLAKAPILPVQDVYFEATMLDVHGCMSQMDFLQLPRITLIRSVFVLT